MRDYHDATLLTASVAWETGTTVLTFKLCSETEQKVSLVIRETAFFEWPRRFPWGKSVSVNGMKVTAANGDNGQRQVEIEMQSGDTILVIGKEVLEDDDTSKFV